MSTPSFQIGFLGLGVMGAAMAARLQSAFGPICVHSRRHISAEPLLAAGAVWAETPAALAERCNLIFTMVGYPRDVEEVYFGADGLLNSALENTILVDFTTSSPALARRIAAAAAEKNAAALDAPVSGGDIGARTGALSIMCGGDPEVFARVRPCLEVLGTTVVHQGPPGTGQACKLCNQLAVSTNLIGVCEALAYARAAGLDAGIVLKSIESGAAGSWSLSKLTPRILAGDFAPGFYVKHLIKDLRIARDEADALGLNLPGLELTLSRYEALARHGFAEAGTQALWKLYTPELCG